MNCAQGFPTSKPLLKENNVVNRIAGIPEDEFGLCWRKEPSFLPKLLSRLFKRVSKRGIKKEVGKQGEIFELNLSIKAPVCQ